MLQAYLRISTEHALAAAFVQFLLLGTAGEVLSTMIRLGRWGYPFSVPKTLLKALGWGLLGVYIKMIFVTGAAGVAALVDKGYLPALCGQRDTTSGLLLAALTTSVLLNVCLGPSMMLLHRVTDNAIDRLLEGSPATYRGLDRSLLTLLWLWIPLHTFTFTQRPELRVGIAAVLSLLLGVVMGYFNRQAPAAATAAPDAARRG